VNARIDHDALAADVDLYRQQVAVRMPRLVSGAEGTVADEAVELPGS